MPAVLHEIECFMEMQEMDFLQGSDAGVGR